MTATTTRHRFIHVWQCQQALVLLREFNSEGRVNSPSVLDRSLELISTVQGLMYAVHHWRTCPEHGLHCSHSISLPFQRKLLGSCTMYLYLETLALPSVL